MAAAIENNAETGMDPNHPKTLSKQHMTYAIIIQFQECWLGRREGYIRIYHVPNHAKNERMEG